MDDLPLEAIRRLLALADSYHLRELIVEEGGLRITIRTESPAPSTHAAPPHAAVEAPTFDHLESAAEPEEEIGLHHLRSPMTGIFYRSGSPQAPPFVQAGSVVSPGDVIGLIEAMKLFNEVRSTVAGRVRRIVAENGQLVRAHQPLIEVE